MEGILGGGTIEFRQLVPWRPWFWAGGKSSWSGSRRRRRRRRRSPSIVVRTIPSFS